jgi:hypothetical protein
MQVSLLTPSLEAGTGTLSEIFSPLLKHIKFSTFLYLGGFQMIKEFGTGKEMVFFQLDQHITRSKRLIQQARLKLLHLIINRFGRQFGRSRLHKVSKKFFGD